MTTLRSVSNLYSVAQREFNDLSCTVDSFLLPPSRAECAELADCGCLPKAACAKVISLVIYLQEMDSKIARCTSYLRLNIIYERRTLA